jgi:hypothetical protein
MVHLADVQLAQTVIDDRTERAQQSEDRRAGEPRWTFQEENTGRAGHQANHVNNESENHFHGGPLCKNRHCKQAGSRRHQRARFLTLGSMQSHTFFKHAAKGALIDAPHINARFPQYCLA